MDAYQFFYEHAGYSYDPATETPERGRQRCASNLTLAEKQLRKSDLRFFWSQDHEYSDDTDHALWSCYLMDGESTTPLASLGGIDLGDGGGPFDYRAGMLGEPQYVGKDPYCRVVEAELAWEYFSELSQDPAQVSE